MSFSAIHRPSTAFSISPGKKKRPRERNLTHLKWVSTLPCVVCGKRPVQVAHIRSAYPQFGKRQTGLQEKPDDSWVTPLCVEHHEKQHGANEMFFWRRWKIDPFIVALALWRASGDDEAGEQIIRMNGQAERRP